MPEVGIDKKTRWECQRCGECCNGIIIFTNKNLSMVKDGEVICRFFDSLNNFCLNYNEGPFICRLYLFIIKLGDIVKDGIARPEKAFLLENMKIHSECHGYGKGKRVFWNKNLQRKLEKIGHEFAVRFKECFEKGRGITKII